MQRTYQLKLFGALRLPEHARTRLVACGKPRRFASGQFVMHEGEQADGFGVVTEGQVMLGRHGSNGTLTVFGIMGPGDMFGEQAFLGNTPRLVDAVADGPAEIAWIGAAAFRKAIDGDNQLAMLMMRSLAAQLQVAIERVDAMRRMTLDQRVASALLSMCNVTDGVIETTQQELADLVGVSRVSLGGALRQLERNGAVALSYGKIVIREPRALETKLRLGAAPKD
jgi:CRP/FNR family transcriptional regulator, cyclic AMP receptor protein